MHIFLAVFFRAYIHTFDDVLVDSVALYGSLLLVYRMIGVREVKQRLNHLRIEHLVLLPQV